MRAFAPPALAVLIGIALSGGAGCGRRTVRERVPVPDMDALTWTGRSQDAVLEVWGRPSDRKADGEGGTILVYHDLQVHEETEVERSKVSVSAETSRPGSPVTENPDLVVSADTQAMFWLDPDGKVYRTWFSPALYKKGIPVPPSERPAPAGGTM